MMPFKSIFGDALQFFVRNLRQIFTLCMPFLLAGALMNHVILGPQQDSTFSPDRFLILLAVNMALYPLYTGALIMLMASQADNRLPTNSELISAALSIYPQMLLLGVVGRTLVMLGLLFFVLPGIWFSVRLAFCEFFLVVERLDPQAAIYKSFQATRPHFFPILTALALIAMPVFMLVLVTENALAAMQAHAGIQVAVNALVAFASLFLDVVMFRIFLEAGRSPPDGAVA